MTRRVRFAPIRQGAKMENSFVRVGNLYINLRRVDMIRDYPEAGEVLVVFSNQQPSELMGGHEREDLIRQLQEHPAVVGAV